jgi:tetratricopeptide (TPR) repeat protein
MDEYLAALDAGRPPDRDEFLARHAAVAGALAKCLDGLEFIRAAAPRLHASAASSLPPPPVDAEGRLGDFRILREVGRGGMGVVYEAEQISMGRRVALKVLPFAAVMDPRHLQRFKNEARAAGSLQHPNIVPVYIVGSERGVHYFAMQFIEGQTLAALIRQLRQSASPEEATTAYSPADGLGNPTAATAPAARQSTLANSTPPKGRQHFRQVAEWGEKAAEALDHAHHTGIVHRDVKPSNLMLDSRGDLWLTDFGLARVQQGEADLTITGDLVGTLRYMSPEQALAKRVLIDHRTDVYSLGVTLYELLTLEPVFAGGDRHELLRQIAFEEPRPPRRLNRAIPVELETIVQKAIEKNPQDRYATAKDMADDLRRYLEDQPIRARRPGVVKRARGWARRHKALVGSAAAAALVAGLMAAGVAWWRERERAGRQVATEVAVTAALAQARTLADEGEKQRDDPEHWQVAVRLARSAVERAEGLLAAGEPTEELSDEVRLVRAAVDDAAADADLLAELDRIRARPRAAQAAGSDDAWAARAYTGLLPRYGMVLEDPEGSAARVRASRVRDALLIALQDWLRTQKEPGERKRVAAMLRAAQPAPDAFRARWRAAFARKDAAALVRLAQEPAVRGMPVEYVNELAMHLHSLRQWPPAERLLRAALERDPGNFWLNHDLALVLLGRGPTHAAEALGYARAALALRPRNPSAHNLLGLSAQESVEGRLDEAIAHYREAIRLDKGFPSVHNNLGTALLDQGRLDDAIAAFREALRLSKDYALAHGNLGSALREKGQLDEAIVECREAIRLDKDCAGAHANLGAALTEKGRADEAIAECREAIRLKQDLPEAHNELGAAFAAKGRLDEAIAEFRETIHLKKNLAGAHNNLGNALMDKGRLPEAMVELRAAIGLKKNLPVPHFNLGNALRETGRLDEAILHYREALRLKKDYAAAHNNLGSALMGQGQLDEAIRHYREALRLKKDDPTAHNNLGSALFSHGRLSEAMAEYREAIRLNENYSEAHNNLGLALHKTGRPQEAIAEFRESIRLKHDFADPHCGLGNILFAQKDFDGAIMEFGAAVRLKGDDFRFHANLGNGLVAKRRLREAIAEYREAVRLNKDEAVPRCSLGLTLLEAGQFDEAVEVLRNCHQLASRDPRLRDASADWLRQAEQLARLDARLRAIRDAKAKPKDAAEAVSLADLCHQPYKQLYATSTRLSQEAFAAQPMLADGLGAHHGYNAARAAALAGCGQGKDQPRPDQAKRGAWRKQALAWLRADLVTYAKLVEGGPAQARAAVGQRLEHWRQDPDLAGVRDAAALAHLPEAERDRWRRLWAEVEQVLTRARVGPERTKKGDAKGRSAAGRQNDP